MRYEDVLALLTPRQRTVYPPSWDSIRGTAGGEIRGADIDYVWIDEMADLRTVERFEDSNAGEAHSQRAIPFSPPPHFTLPKHRAYTITGPIF